MNSVVESVVASVVDSVVCVAEIAVAYAETMVAQNMILSNLNLKSFVVVASGVVLEVEIVVVVEVTAVNSREITIPLRQEVVENAEVATEKDASMIE